MDTKYNNFECIPEPCRIDYGNCFKKSDVHFNEVHIYDYNSVEKGDETVTRKVVFLGMSGAGHWGDNWKCSGSIALTPEEAITIANEMIRVAEKIKLEEMGVK